MTKCLPCPPGRAVYVNSTTLGNKPGPTVCPACAKGHFAGNYSQEQCGECAVNTYAPTTGASICTDCTVGMRTDNDKQDH
jgi:hypothetical protein